MTKRIAFMVSGNGTNMENLVRGIQSGDIDAKAEVVISDQPAAGALGRAKRLGLPAVVIDRKDFESKVAFERKITVELETRQIDFICLAGFMRILSASFVDHFPARILNIHPSYLPEFPGAHSIRDAFEAKVKETGVTVHFVTEGVDSGPIILQRRVPVLPEDTLGSLEDRVHAVEYELYPEALNKVLKENM